MNPGATAARAGYDVRVSLWRGAAGFRIAAAAYAIALILRDRDRYAHPGLGLVVALIIAVVTVALVAAVGAGLPGAALRLVAGVVVLDVAICGVLTLATRWVQTPADYRAGRIPTLTTVWAAGPLLEAAVVAGVAWALAAAAAQFGVSVLTRGGADNATVANGVLLVLAAMAVGYAARVATRGQEQLIAAAASQATFEERARLARAVHDGALQALALVQRRLREPVDAAARAQLAQLAGEQEIAMRMLLAGAQPAATGGQIDLLSLLRPRATERVTVSGPATGVLLDPVAASELAAAVAAALDNVEQHAGPGTRAWVLVEASGAGVTVTVRDDGAGMDPTRPAAAAAQGRLGISASICGRVQALGGRVEIATGPGSGVELTLHVPAAGGAGSRATIAA